MQKTTGKRLVSLLLTMALLISGIPATVRSASASENATEVVAETPSNRTTIYISTSGSELFSGKSSSWPKKDITKIPTYLAKGYNVMLKRGDVWELPRPVTQFCCRESKAQRILLWFWVPMARAMTLLVPSCGKLTTVHGHWWILLIMSTLSIFRLKTPGMALVFTVAL